MGRTLTARLVAVVLLLLAVAAAVITVSTTLVLRGTLLARLDMDLARTAERAAADPEGVDDGRGPRPITDTVTAVFAGPRVDSAVIVDQDRDVDDLEPATITQLQAVAPADGPHSLDLVDEGPYRVLAVTRSGYLVVVGLSEEPMRDTVSRLVVAGVAVSSAVLAGAGGLGLVLVRRELRPLKRVAATAERVSALRLDRGEVSLAERVPDADPRTEVGTVGVALNTMLDHVGSALAARQRSETRLRQFVADASHELRTPLAAIRGYAELAGRGPLSPEAQHSVGRISSQTERMTALVEDLLLLARLDAGRPLERAEVDLTRLVVDTVGDAHVAGPGHRWRLDLPDEPVTVVGDGARLTQVLVNLLANARTHTPPGTTVTVALTSGAGVRLTVVDDGPGIPPGLVPHVFERFARGSESRSREHGSTGLGLSIVDAVVAAHGGRVEVHSRPGRTEFRVLLPPRG